MPTFYIKTFGCQMNDHDSQKMEAMLRLEGCSRVTSPEEADLIVFNTCSIREKSYQKAVSEIGRFAGIDENGRKTTIAVTGCVASHDGKNLLSRFPFIDIVLGPDHIADLPKLAKLVREQNEKQLKVEKTDFRDLSDYEFPAPSLLNNKEEKKITSYVAIMKGCDKKCSFCIVPYVRGKEVSRPSHDIIEVLNLLVAQGAREVTLLGQNVTSYGKGLQNESFARLLRLIDEQTSIDRIRYTSPHPKDLSQELIEEHRQNQKLCPHIHLPVQSGANRILKKMRRSYTRETYLRKIETLRTVVPGIAVTTDFIVGFPGETDADFEDTLSLVKEVGYDASYSFVFSSRPHTEASQFLDDVPLETKKERLAKLQEIQASLSLEKNESLIGKVEEVLVEGKSGGEKGQLTGRTPHGKIVNFIGDESKIGDILRVEINWASSYSLKGVLC